MNTICLLSTCNISNICSIVFEFYLLVKMRQLKCIKTPGKLNITAVAIMPPLFLKEYTNM